MKDFQQRVIQEKADLDLKIQKLGYFFEGQVWPTLPGQEQNRLSRQYGAMKAYSDVLGERITAFDPCYHA